MKLTKSLIPTLFTAGNAFLGFLSIYFSMNQDWGTAGVCIFYATVLDLFDGRLARLLNVSDNFGKDMDSFADFLSFGIAPAIMFVTLCQDFFNAQNWAPVLLYFIAFTYVFGAAARLAIFNNPTGTYVDKVKKINSSDFVGMPSTFMGGILGFLMGFSGFSNGFFGQYIPEMFIPAWLFTIIIPISAVCLLIPIPFPKVGKVFFAFKQYPITNFIIISGLFLICRWVLLIMSTAYIILPIVFYFLRKLNKKNVS